MRKVGFISEENDHRLPIYPDSIKEYGRKKIKIYATKYNLQTHTFTRVNEPIFIKDLNVI